MVSKMSKSPSEETELEVLNLEDVLKRYAEPFLDSDQKKIADLDRPVINWKFMHVTHGETDYTRSSNYGAPTAHVIFTANFANDTPHTQTYTLHTQRTTKSTCNVTFRRAFTYGGNLSLNLSPPTSVIGASVGFKREITKERGVSDASEQELTWSVNNQIEVESGHQTEAKLIIKEDKYAGNFTMRCTFEGKVIVTYLEKKTNEHVKTVTASTKNIFGSCKEFIKDNQERPVFIVKGVCKCKYGIEQNVSLKQSPIVSTAAISEPAAEDGQ